MKTRHERRTTPVPKGFDMSAVPSELQGAVNQARVSARQVERHVISGTRPDRDELRGWRGAFDNLADLLEGVLNELDRQHHETI